MEHPSTTTSNPVGTGDETGLSRRAGLLAGMRIRKKLIFLHTCFSLALAGLLGLALWPAVGEVVRESEQHEARVVLALALGDSREFLSPTGIEVRMLTPPEAGFSESEGAAIRAEGDAGRVVSGQGPGTSVAAWDDARGRFIIVTSRLDAARSAVVKLYVLMTAALLAVYGLVAAALEIFVLPEHVYGPISAMLRADLAVREGRTRDEQIPDDSIPADEMGEIMRSRNATVASLRRHEADLGAALAKLEEVANDLRRKNHLIEMARQNLADADRLASLGMMSAGIAHELNTPLAVLKGMVEKVRRGATPAAGGGRFSGVSSDEAELMVRVVGRLERLSESLLDFARVRPAEKQACALRPLIEEAWTLVRLDREAAEVVLDNAVAHSLIIECDADRLVQVLVNLLRNATDALIERPSDAPRIAIAAESTDRDGRAWVSLTITDNGPGIPTEALSRLFQPFVTTRLDARGTGLGLAVAEGIVREHGGVILARNRADRAGAVFEIMLPARQAPSQPAHAEAVTVDSRRSTAATP